MLNDFAEVIYNSLNYPNLTAILVLYRVALIVNHYFVTSRLHLYEKLFVHGSAHGGKAITAVTNKELCAVIHLVGELEQSVNRLKGEVGDM